MSDTAGVKTFDLKWFGTLSQKQLLILLASFLIALVLTILGFGTSCYCLGMVVIAVILYMLPRFFGVENVKLMTMVGVLFAVCAILIGGLAMAPGVVAANEGNPPDNDYFSNVQFTYTDGGVNITADVTYTDFNPAVYSVHFMYGEVRGITFNSINPAYGGDVELSVTDGHASGSISLDRNTLHAGYLTLMKDDGIGNLTEFGSSTRLTVLTGAFGGSLTELGIYGCFVVTLYIIIIFFLILVLSSFTRGRIEKTREKMEKEGRLYPPGYGRCEQCGAVVLPGEVNCRKCGAYIDRPEEMKPKKKDFFECSECGAEVPMDATHCPKCGAVFDEDEFEVVHADGTTETTKESFVCPECGAMVPGTASFCTKCGAKFNK